MSHDSAKRELGLGLRLRTERESHSNADSTWITLHHVGSTSLAPSSGALSLSIVGYSGLFRRDVREGVLLVPFTPPVRIPFPLDLAFLTGCPGLCGRRLKDALSWHRARRARMRSVHRAVLSARVRSGRRVLLVLWDSAKGGVHVHFCSSRAPDSADLRGSK